MSTKTVTTRAAKWNRPESIVRQNMRRDRLPHTTCRQQRKHAGREDLAINRFPYLQSSDAAENRSTLQLFRFRLRLWLGIEIRVQVCLGDLRLDAAWRDLGFGDPDEGV